MIKKKIDNSEIINGGHVEGRFYKILFGPNKMINK